MYCPRLHFNEIGTFILSLKSRAIHATIITMLFDQLVCGNQLHYEALGRNIYSFQDNLRKSNGHKLQVLKLGQLFSFSFLIIFNYCLYQ